jgi:hypothetical protein
MSATQVVLPPERTGVLSDSSVMVRLLDQSEQEQKEQETREAKERARTRHPAPTPSPMRRQVVRPEYRYD